ncbi:MAG: hypothetical protein RSA49_05210 [Anaerovoracaceae bacterium]
MSKVKVVLNKAEVRQMLRSNEMESICLAEANKVKAKAGEGYEVNTRKGKTRVNAMCYAKTYEAMNSNRKHNTLLKALGK